jgi:hypothetical protein
VSPRARLLAVAGAVVVVVAAVVVVVTHRPGPDVPAVTTTTAPSEAVEAPTVDVAGGRARVQVHVDTVERQGDLRVVYYEVENTGPGPVDTTRLRAEVDDAQGRRFRQQPATADDTRGILQPGQAGVIAARFKLPAGAEPAVLYVAEAGVAAGTSQPIPIP